MMSSVLVTGASGFVGKSLLKLLKREGYHVIPLVRSPGGLPEEIVLDFTDDYFISKVKEITPVNAIIHLGARVDWGVNKGELFVPNVLATASLANWARSIGAYFIFASTVTVCGATTPLITSESTPDPNTNYAYSKWVAEEVIKMSEAEHLILRISGIYGRNGSQHLGINNAITGALQDKAPTQFGKGDIKRNYIYVEDLTRIIVDCLNRRITGTHLVAGPEVISIADMLSTICQVFLPGTDPIYRDGDQGLDQIIEHSDELIPGRKFREALDHIKGGANSGSCSCSR